MNYAWPSAEIAVMGPAGAVEIISKDAIRKAEDPPETRRKLVAEYVEKFANPYVAAAKGYLDDVIDPRQTRSKLIKSLEALRNKTESNPVRKHGNLPL